AQRLAVLPRGILIVARLAEAGGPRPGLREARLRKRRVVADAGVVGRLAAATGHNQQHQPGGEPTHQRARPLPSASKLSIGSRPSEVSLKESLSGQTRFAAPSTSPASRAAT